jgi:hypothetical protein
MQRLRVRLSLSMEHPHKGASCVLKKLGGRRYRILSSVAATTVSSQHPSAPIQFAKQFLATHRAYL